MDLLEENALHGLAIIGSRAQIRTVGLGHSLPERIPAYLVTAFTPAGGVLFVRIYADGFVILPSTTGSATPLFAENADEFAELLGKYLS